MIALLDNDGACDNVVHNPGRAQVDQAFGSDGSSEPSACAAFTKRVSNGYDSMEEYDSSDDGKEDVIE